MSFFQAIVLGILQGVSELFPVSSLGHSVLLPPLLHWHGTVFDAASAKSGSPYLAFVVGLHVATAIALAAFFWRDWVRIIEGFLRTLRTRRIETPDEHLAWLLIAATVPAGIVGLLFEHRLRELFSKPLAAAIFLTINGAILASAELLRKRSAVIEVAAQHQSGTEGADHGHDLPARRLGTLQFRESFVVGMAQVFALLAGISRSGITMVAGLVRGLDHEDAARFSFLLATPVILAAGLVEIPDLLGSGGNGIRPQVLVGSACAVIAAYLSVRFLVRWFTTRTLWPFAIYCVAAGGLCIVRFA